MSASTANRGFVELRAADRDLRLEFAWVGSEAPGAPLLVFLHEGLGSVAMWKDFPAQLCAVVGARGLVYSRPGYGYSTPRPHDERWGLDFMHLQAQQVLPALLDALGVRQPYWLFGHSDGGSIALIHAATFAPRVAGTVVMAPHILVEEFGLRSIREARRAYVEGDLRARLAKYHADVDSAFWGWNRIWLDDGFPRWSIEALLPGITGPVLAIQGHDDPYGTMAQIDGIARALPRTELLKLPGCGHSPHRDQPAAVIAGTRAFLQQHLTETTR
ncbi:alpha/beta fold hydrolase [Azohydromonas caseinilytica]|uniref:Alpha/beta hydrolase n=1 Tax=Azohydromonas caseinilytica TaxID=2728836 RepID=A0A848FMG7_9BURK|nr:alpha/beta hydrolase [Azohydromonas caseinilytica]NML18951.1 alpha/beta hydrolase [Azohydromonas caseinilytica]